MARYISAEAPSCMASINDETPEAIHRNEVFRLFKNALLGNSCVRVPVRACLRKNNFNEYMSKTESQYE